MDFIFGTLATDDLKLLHHRAAYHGIHHLHDLTPRVPQADEPVQVRVITGVEIELDNVACYFTTDGSQPQGSCGIAENGATLELERIETRWDTFIWGYVSIWQATLPPQPRGTLVRYSISGWNTETELFAETPNVKKITDSAASMFFKGQPMPDLADHTGIDSPTVFAYHVGNFPAPEWAWNSTIYHIFIDRFYPGDGRDWLTPSSLSDFHGGTLWGVRDKMDYIEALGADCIWLSPLFPSPSHHGYDATSYEHVEARLGGDEALHAVVEAAHQRGIRVLLDFAANHLSNHHPYFQEAINNPASPYRDWFYFDESPLGYRAFFNVETLPEINLENPLARQWMIDNALYWLREFDLDGYRLDHANGPTPAFWSEFWTACKRVKPDSLYFGEVVDAPSVQQSYIGRLDGLLDFHVGDKVRKVFAKGEQSRADLERFLAQHYRYFPDDFVMPTFVDNHDMDRFLYLAGGNTEALKAAADTLLALPQPHIIYYGTEVGLSQPKGTADGLGLEASRMPMLWGDAQDTDLLAFYQDRIHARRDRNA